MELAVWLLPSRQFSLFSRSLWVCVLSLSYHDKFWCFGRACTFLTSVWIVMEWPGWLTSISGGYGASPGCCSRCERARSPALYFNLLPWSNAGVGHTRTHWRPGWRSRHTLLHLGQHLGEADGHREVRLDMLLTSVWREHESHVAPNDTSEEGGSSSCLNKRNTQTCNFDMFIGLDHKTNIYLFIFYIFCLFIFTYFNITPDSPALYIFSTFLLL